MGVGAPNGRTAVTLASRVPRACDAGLKAPAHCAGKPGATKPTAAHVHGAAALGCYENHGGTAVRRYDTTAANLQKGVAFAGLKSVANCATGLSYISKALRWEFAGLD